MTRLAILVFAGLALIGCAQRFIPNTDVEDTEENREVIHFCEQYRLALEARDVARLLSMVADDYYEDGGTPSGEDDYDRAGLELRLRTRFQRVEVIRYDIRYRRVVHFPDRVEVYYTYYGRFQVAGQTEGESLWFSEVGDNRLVLARVPGGYRILSGL